MKNVFDQIEELKKQDRSATPESFWPKLQSDNTANNNSSLPGQNKLPNDTQNSKTNTNTTNMENINCAAANRKLITKTLDVAALAAAGTYGVDADFGKEYKKIIGYAFFVITQGGLTDVQIKLGMSDSSRLILEPTTLPYFLISSAVPVKDRLNTSECIEMANGKITVNIVTLAALVGALQIQIVALCERAN